MGSTHERPYEIAASDDLAGRYRRATLQGLG